MICKLSFRFYFVKVVAVFVLGKRGINWICAMCFLKRNLFRTMTKKIQWIVLYTVRFVQLWRNIYTMSAKDSYILHRLYPTTPDKHKLVFLDNIKIICFCFLKVANLKKWSIKRKNISWICNESNINF